VERLVRRSSQSEGGSDTHQLHLKKMMGFAGSTHPTYCVLRTRIGRDDLIDACACAVAARDGTSRLGGDEVDISGLQMQINCGRGQGRYAQNSPAGKSVSSPDAKNISLHSLVETALWIPTVSSHRGAYRDRHERGAGCGGRGSVRRET